MAAAVFIFLIYLSYSTAQQRCCLPTKYEAVVGAFGGRINPSTGRPESIDSYSFSYYDFDDQKYAFELHLSDNPNVFFFLYDYTAGKRYDIFGGGCFATNITGSLIRDCIPGNATFMGSSYFGSEANQIAFNSWEYSYRVGNYTTAMTVTDDGCLPLTKGIYGIVGREKITQTQFFSDVTLGIRNASVFIPPPSCKKSTHIRSEEHTALLQRYWPLNILS